MKSFSLRYGYTKLYFGLNTIDRLARHISKHKNVAIVTGKRSAKVSGALNDLLRLLDGQGVSYSVYDFITPNPWASQADELARQLVDREHDVVIAVGGGSVIDTAKVATVIALSGGCAVDYLYWRLKPDRMLPLYTVNLTHGTGSEIDRYAVLTVDDNREKRGIAIRYPDVSIDDPRYTMTLPRDQTLYTCLDAFYHSYEALTSTYSNPFSSHMGIQAIEYISGWLGKALEKPGDLEARYWLLYASMAAGIAIDISPTHVIHALEHVLSGLNPRLPHGCGLAIIGPYLIKYIHKASPESSAKALKPIDPGIKPLSEYSGRAMEAVMRFQEMHGFSERLGDYGFDRSDLDGIIKMLFNGLRYLMDGTPFSVSEDVVRDVFMSSL